MDLYCPTTERQHEEHHKLVSSNRAASDIRGNARWTGAYSLVACSSNIKITTPLLADVTYVQFQVPST
jgi:hypothetical protein